MAWKLFFQNASWGGTTSYSVPSEDFPDWPWEESYIIRKDVFRTDTSKVFMKERFRKRKWKLSFRDVSEACKDAIQDLVLSTSAFQFSYELGTLEGTATCFCCSEDWKPIWKNLLWNFDFEFEETEGV